MSNVIRASRSTEERPIARHASAHPLSGKRAPGRKTRIAEDFSSSTLTRLKKRQQPRHGDFFAQKSDLSPLIASAARTRMVDTRLPTGCCRYQSTRNARRSFVIFVLFCFVHFNNKNRRARASRQRPKRAPLEHAKSARAVGHKRRSLSFGAHTRALTRFYQVAKPIDTRQLAVQSYKAAAFTICRRFWSSSQRRRRVRRARRALGGDRRAEARRRVARGA